MKNPMYGPAGPESEPEIEREPLVEQKLAALIRLPTVARIDSDAPEGNRITEFRAFLTAHFPIVCRHLAVEVVGDFSVVLTWRGQTNHDDAGQGDPVVFAGHWDVVSVRSTSAADWVHPPFSGYIDNAYVWGRGALDDKVSIVTMLEAAERLLGAGYAPKNTMIFAFGGDEEIDGVRGARAAAEFIRSRYGRIAMLFDEGSFVVGRGEGESGGPIALIGIAEKGFANLRVSVDANSTGRPRRHADSVYAVLARAVNRIERIRFRSRIIAPVRHYLGVLGTMSGPVTRIAFRLSRLSGAFIRAVYRTNGSMNSLFRTTVAATLFGPRPSLENPAGGAEALVNLRILPGDTIAGALRRIGRAVRDKRIRIELVTSEEASEPVFGTNPGDPAFRLVESAAAAAFPDAIAAPYLVSGSTDSKHYRHLTRQMVRFTPILLSPPEFRLIHGVNERVSHENVSRALVFYRRLIESAGSTELARRRYSAARVSRSPRA